MHPLSDGTFRLISAAEGMLDRSHFSLRAQSFIYFEYHVMPFNNQRCLLQIPSLDLSHVFIQVTGCVVVSIQLFGASFNRRSFYMPTAHKRNGLFEGDPVPNEPATRTESDFLPPSLEVAGSLDISAKVG
jgi:hypothetical protein